MTESMHAIKSAGRLVPTTPALTRRYNGSSKFPRRHMALFSTAIHRELPPGWEKYTHPEGKSYFYQRNLHLITETNIESKDCLKEIVMWHEHVYLMFEKRGIKFTAATEIVLDLDCSTTPHNCLYYLVDYSERREFWLEDTTTESLGMDMVFSPDHLQLGILEHFWTHVEYFPMHRPMPDRADQDLVSTLTHAVTDQLTSEESTAPFTATECERFLGLLANLKSDDGAKTCVVARLWRVIVHSQFINLYGHDGARLSRTQSILQDEHLGNPSKTLIWFCKIFLLNAPDTYLQALRNLWVDRVVYAEHWNKFMDGVQKDWSNVALMGTLLVAIDVSFLGETENYQRVAALFSTLFGTSAVISSVLLTRRHRGASESNAASAGSYLEQAQHEILGLQPLAIVYSIPIAFFHWSLVWFATTVVLHCNSVLLDLLSTSFPVFAFGATILSILACSLFWVAFGFWRTDPLFTRWSTILQRWAFVRLA